MKGRYVRKVPKRGGIIQIHFDETEELPEVNMVFLRKEGVLIGSVPAHRFKDFVEAP